MSVYRVSHKNDDSSEIIEADNVRVNDVGTVIFFNGNDRVVAACYQPDIVTLITEE